MSNLGDIAIKPRPVRIVVASMAAGAILIGASETSDGATVTSGESTKNQQEIATCLDKMTETKPTTFRGYLKKDGKVTTAFENFPHVGSPHCRDNAEKNIKLYLLTEDNDGKIKRNSKVSSESYDPKNPPDPPAGSGFKGYEGFASDGDYYNPRDRIKHNKKYTCEPGPGKRKHLVAAKITAEYEGKRQSSLHKAVAVAGNKKC